MSVSRILRPAILAALLAIPAASAWAVGLFTCVDPSGQQVCVVDTGSMTDFSPSGLCNASCPPCAGRCDGARYYPPVSGRWEQSWQVPPGISGNNILVPGASPQADAQTIVREGLAAPAAPQTLPPGGVAYPPQAAYPQGPAYPQPGAGYQQPEYQQPGYQYGAAYPQAGTGYPSGSGYQQPQTTSQQPGTTYYPSGSGS